MIASAPPNDVRELRFVFNSWGCSPSWPKGHRLGRSFFRRRLTDFTVWFFFEGRGTLHDRAAGHRHALGPGVALCLLPGMDLHVEQDDAAPLGNIWIHFDVFHGDKKLPPQTWPYAPFRVEARNFAAADQLMRRILTLLEHPKLPGYDPLENAELEAEFLLKGMLVDWVREAGRPQIAPLDRHHETVIAGLVARIFADPGKFRRASDVASAGGYSVSHFRHLCRKFTDRTPNELLVQARIEKAKIHLRSPELTIGMVAEAVGYENIYYFSRQFREVTGMTAKEFRRAGASAPSGV
ncbi:MAG: helix-turn-helix transcriptional regulator [Chthoniobacterales bacterium]|nr:helix-turn-helix transcriptional regulator [Chthoniobacterales bacterium]